MDIRPWHEILEPDRRTLRFLPDGLGLELRLSADGSADFQQRVVAELELAPAVADGTRRTYERLRGAWVYGVLNYDLFTIVGDAAWLVFEQALREKFLEHHHHEVTFVDAAGVRHQVKARLFDEIYQHVRDHDDHRLLLQGGPATMVFNGGFTHLRQWARRIGLLRGQRVRAWEAGLGTSRNFVAHRDAYGLDSPVTGVRTLADLREWINQLWGTSTPGGRRYPAPVPREVAVIAQARHGVGFAAVPADELLHDADEDGTPLDPDDEWEYVIVRAVLGQPLTRAGELDRFDSLHEVTPYPAELLWGPGPRQQARQWLTSARPEPDECEVLDRIFALRHAEGRLWQPMRPEIAAGLPAAVRGGLWYLVRADFPADSFLHVRNRISGAGCADKGFCTTCMKVETMLAGVPFARAFSPDQRASATTGSPDLAWHGPGFLAEYERSRPVDTPPTVHTD